MSNIPRQIVKNTSALAVARVARLVSNFLLALVLARTLGVTGIGVYTTVLSFFGLAIILCTAGMQDFVAREVARDHSKTNRYLIHTGLLTAIASLAATVIFPLLISQLGYTLETTIGVFIACLALIPATWMAIYEALFVAHHKAEFLLHTAIFGFVGRVGVSVYLLLQGYGVISVLVTLVIFQYASFALGTFFLTRFIIVPRWEFEFSFAVRLVKELRVFSTIGFLAGIFAEIEIILLSFLGGEEAVGVYSAAIKLIVMWLVIPDSYMRAVFPVLSRAHVGAPDSFHRLAEKSVKYLLALALPLGIGTAIIADKIIYLVYGSEFAASVPVLRWLSLLLIPFFLNEVLWRVLIARDQQRLCLRTVVAGTGTKGGVSLATVPFISYMGTVLAVLLTQVVSTSMYVFYIQHTGKRIRIFHLIWRFAIAAAVMGACTWLLAMKFNLLIVVPTAIAVYALLVVLLKGFSAEDFALFYWIWRPKMTTED
jgi:O-antigen/teichoic acid export membrane protein